MFDTHCDLKFSMENHFDNKNKGSKMSPKSGQINETKHPKLKRPSLNHW